MEIRQANLDDLEKLKEIKILSKKEELKYSDTLRNIDKNRERYLSYLRNDLSSERRAVFIAIEDGKVVGMIIAKHFRALMISKFERKGFITNLHVLPDQRKKGIGGKLAQKAVDWLKSKGVEHITLEIHKENKGAFDLYHKLGFKDYTVKLSKKV